MNENILLTLLQSGHENGDTYCTLLLEEYEHIATDEELRKKFVKTVANEVSIVAYKKWLMVHKNVFYDDRFYSII